MRGRFLLIILALGIGFPTPGRAQNRLVSQRVEGANRLCIYDVRTPNRIVRGERRATGQGYHVVGRGEPCPTTYRAPARPRTVIPSMAVLRTTGEANGRKICVYHHAGRDYVQHIPLLSACPLTPLFAGE